MTRRMLVQTEATVAMLVALLVVAWPSLAGALVVAVLSALAALTLALDLSHARARHANKGHALTLERQQKELDEAREAIAALKDRQSRHELLLGQRK